MNEKTGLITMFFLVGIMLGCMIAIPIANNMTQTLDQKLTETQNKLDSVSQALTVEENLNDELTIKLESIKLQYNSLSIENSKLKIELQQLQSNYAQLYSEWLALKEMIP